MSKNIATFRSQSKSQSLNVVPFDGLDGFLLAFYSNVVLMTHLFEIFDFKVP